jgi:hypothetical protein
MLAYRCYFLGTNDRIVARDEFEASGDGEALARARALYAGRGDVGHGFELWQGKRRVQDPES